MDPEALEITFRNYAQRHGGPIDMVDDDPTAGDFLLCTSVLAVVRSLRRCNSKGIQLAASIGFIDRLEPQAWVEKVDDIHYCAVTYAYYLVSLGLTTHLLRHTSWLADIGQVPDEVSTAAMPLAAGPELIASIRSAKARMLIPSWQVDHKREEAALFLRFCLLSLVILHEYGHASLGHAEICEHIGIAGPLYEFGPRAALLSDRHLYLWFEYLADQHAMRFLTGLVDIGADFMTTMGVVKLSRFDKLRIVVVAAGIMSATWHAYAVHAGTPDEIHPAPSRRFIAFMNAARFRLTHQGRDKKEIDRVLSIAIEDMFRLGKLSPEARAALTDFRKDSVGSFPENPGIQAFLNHILEYHSNYQYADFRVGDENYTYI